jgi:glycosyltransferase involved in cell wall biosynthesis
MRIGINGRFLVAKRTGVQRAAYNLLRTLVQIDRKNEYIIFTGQSQLDNPDWKYPNVTVVPANVRIGESLRNHIWEQFSLPRLAKKYKVDLLHSPANMAPLFYRGKSVVHIHDLCFVVNPQWYSFSFHTLYNFLIPRLARRATRVITNSNNSKNDLLQFCDVPASKVSLIYWAVDDMFSTEEAKPSVSSEPLLGDDFILYVGSLEPRKNIRTLIKAYEVFRNRNPSNRSKLVLIGGESPLFGEVRLKVKDYKEDVVFKGFVDDTLLREFYRRAKMVVYPSLYEGFGLPPLEAMASGTPVVTSNTSSIPEVVGGAAIMVNPYDIEQLASAIEAVTVDDGLRRRLVESGYEQVKRFNWYRVARNTLTVYHEVYSTLSNGAGPVRPLPMDVWRELRQIENQWLQKLAAGKA